MGKKKPTPVEDLIIPPQDGKICGVICICQLTFVLSTVAIVYLTVAIYMPSSRAFKSGIDETPVMCTTTKALNKDACEWGSCGEWCLSKTSGACIQIYVHLRNNGSSLTFQNCTNSANKTCYGIDQENAKKARCIADECKNLTGTFNCTTGMCINITDAFECVFHNTDVPLKCSGRRGKITCIDINGLFSCNRGTCRKIKTPYNFAIDAATNQEVWNESDGKVIMSSCYTIQNTTNGIQATDCVNGSLLEKDELTDLTNFTYLSYLHYAVSTPVKTIAPLEQDLTISNESGLMINLEGCVNTLQDECKDFLKEYGKDGTDHNARARFPCFHSKGNTDKVVARFNLETTYKQFVVGFVVPTVLFAVSCLTLIFCQKTIHVGDDAKMRFVGCANKEGSTANGGAKNKANANSGDGGGGGDSVMAL
ncbi:hypothetical protein quinque_002101 [Culex quinquefasciatus]|uniref:Uncharacterized protein n=1 Tax=Culex pipiens pipiens TaxID=38569 RepID=A0ABD1CSX0_CULPP